MDSLRSRHGSAATISLLTNPGKMPLAAWSWHKSNHNAIESTLVYILKSGLIWLLSCPLTTRSLPLVILENLPSGSRQLPVLMLFCFYFFQIP